jgi:N-acetylglucosamine kinase-like BadF-type ATPase
VTAVAIAFTKGGRASVRTTDDAVTPFHGSELLVMSTLFLGVDGGNTKTIALVARADGTIVGAATGGCADIYGASSPSAALEVIEMASRSAITAAGLEPRGLDGVAFSLAGADWPEDHALYRRELQRRLKLPNSPIVVNDSLGGLWAGSPDGVGVSVMCGTFGGIGARGRDGRTWHVGFWLASSSAIELVRQAVQAMIRATLEFDPPTSLTVQLPEFFGDTTPEELLHHLTRRENPPSVTDMAKAAPAVIDAADGGDDTARRLVIEAGIVLADYARAAARRVGLVEDPHRFPLILGGGLLRHPSPLLIDTIVDRVAASMAQARPVIADLPPAAGSVLLAMDAAGVAADPVVRRRLRSTLGNLGSQMPHAREKTIRVPGESVTTGEPHDAYE